jgi:hypothetical protein
VIPLALVLIFVVLYFQFRSIPTSLNVFSGIFVAWSGGFMMLWLYSQPWFLDFNVFDVSMRELFQVRPYNLSVAVWVGFLALFGIASNDGVIYSTYLDQVFASRKFHSVAEIREATLDAGVKRQTCADDHRDRDPGADSCHDLPGKRSGRDGPNGLADFWRHGYRHNNDFRGPHHLLPRKGGRI